MRRYAGHRDLPDTGRRAAAREVAVAVPGGELQARARLHRTRGRVDLVLPRLALHQDRRTEWRKSTKHDQYHNQSDRERGTGHDEHHGAEHGPPRRDDIPDETRPVFSRSIILEHVVPLSALLSGGSRFDWVAPRCSGEPPLLVDGDKEMILIVIVRPHNVEYSHLNDV